MRGGLRWLYRPFQVLCVLVAVLLAAAFSLQSGFAGHSGGLGERLNANTIAIVSGNPNATYLAAAYYLSAAERRSGDGGGSGSAVSAVSRLAGAREPLKGESD